MGTKTTNKSDGASLVSKLGIFSVFLFVALFATYFYSPVIGTHADDNAGSLAAAWVESVASITADSRVSLNITPTESGAFVSQPITVKAKSNTTAGYKVFLSSVDASTDMTSATSADVISSNFSGTVTSSTMGSNKWGYSTNNTDFSAIPAVSNPATILDTTTSTAGVEATVPIYVGAKVNSNLKSGAYTKNIVFSVLAYQLPKTIFDIEYMQEMDGTVCAATTTPNNSTSAYQVTHVNTTDKNYIPEAELIDSRDNKTYIVRKYANGECWMAQNLELDFKTETDGYANDMTVPSGETLANAVHTAVKTGTFSADWISKTDITDTTEFNKSSNAVAQGKFYATQSVPTVQNVNNAALAWADNGRDGAHSFSTQASGLKNYIVYNCTDNTQPCDDTTNPHVTAGDGYYTFREADDGEPYQRVGNYYNFAAATAGYLGEATGEQPNSICPKGWQLPTNSGARSFKNLIDTYYVTGEGKSYTPGANNTPLYNWLNGAPLDFWRGGFYNRSNGGIWDRTIHAYWWESVASSGTNGYGLRTDVDSGTGRVWLPGNNLRGYGFYIRCVARQ